MIQTPDLSQELGHYKHATREAHDAWILLRWGFTGEPAEQALMERILLQMHRENRLWVPLEMSGLEELDQFVFSRPLSSLEQKEHVALFKDGDTTYVNVTPKAFFKIAEQAGNLLGSPYANARASLIGLYRFKPEL